MVSTLGPPVGGITNRERSGERDLCVSAALRRIPDVRHVDVDFVQYCPFCRAVEVVIEASSDPRKASDLARRFAKQLTATTLLLIHRYGDADHEHPVVVSTWTSTGTKTRDKVEMSWSEFLEVMHDFHEEHIATECVKTVRSAA